jgi:hypothetical protein
MLMEDLEDLQSLATEPLLQTIGDIGHGIEKSESGGAGWSVANTSSSECWRTSSACSAS